MANLENRIATLFTEKVLKIGSEKQQQKISGMLIYMGINQNSFTSNKLQHKADSFI